MVARASLLWGRYSAPARCWSVNGALAVPPRPNLLNSAVMQAAMHGVLSRVYPPLSS